MSPTGSGGSCTPPKAATRRSRRLTRDRLANAFTTKATAPRRPAMPSQMPEGSADKTAVSCPPERRRRCGGLSRSRSLTRPALRMALASERQAVHGLDSAILAWCRHLRRRGMPRARGASIAYQVFGEGPALVMAPLLPSHLDLMWIDPAFTRRFCGGWAHSRASLSLTPAAWACLTQSITSRRWRRPQTTLHRCLTRQALIER
jgi:hypothetical protein